jgi:hypothetical protein
MVTAALFGCLGCAVHRSSSREFYKLVDIDSQYFLLPPERSEAQEAHQTIQISRGGPQGHRLPGSGCSIHGQWFSLYPAQVHGTAYWNAETPSTRVWEQSGGSVDMKVEWNKFLKELSSLTQEECFASVDELASIRQRIIESMATPADDSLFYRYSYGPGGYVDLIPGMELRIERNLFAAGAGGPQDRGNYQGTITTSYGLVQNADREFRLKLLRREGDYKKFSASVDGLPDTTLAAKFQASSHLRLLLQSLAVSADVKSPAVLLGSQDTARLDEATRAFVSNPRMSCSDLKDAAVTCVDFDGVVTVSPMLQVVVNRRTTYVPLGSRIWFVFPHSSNNSNADILKTMRMRRIYQGRYVDVQFARNEQDMGQILLFEGDEISWPKHSMAHP